MTQTIFILYVHDQARSKLFYRHVLEQEPILDQPGMTEFALPGGSSLGLMPVAGIKRLLGKNLPDPANAQGIPRAELYLSVKNAAQHHQRALAAGAVELAPFQLRDWGDQVAYVLDPDGHVLAFAEIKIT